MARKPDGRPARQAGDGAPPDYAVGYGKPPRHSRFQPGRSGNPRGKPKGCVNLRALLEKELQQPTVVTEGGRQQRLNKAELLIKTTLNRAIKGDGAALKLLLQLGADTILGGKETALEPQDTPDAAADQAILARYAARHSGNSNDHDANDPA